MGLPVGGPVGLFDLGQLGAVWPVARNSELPQTCLYLQVVAVSGHIPLL